MTKIIPIFLVTFLTVISQTFLKKGLMNIGGIKTENLSSIFLSFLKLIQEKYFIIAVAIAMVSAILWLIVISRNDLTVAFPIAGGIFYVLLFLSSLILLNEQITISRILGAIIIVGGILLIY